MIRSYEFSFTSHLAAPAAVLWVHATSMDGVNRELWPLVQMTYPANVTALEAATIPLGQRLFRSWILLFGILPIDYDDLTFVEIDIGSRFLERSPMLTQREWQHQRTIEPLDEGCTVTDSIRFTPRLPGIGAFLLPIFRLAFRLRHRNLRRLFGQARANTAGR